MVQILNHLVLNFPNEEIKSKAIEQFFSDKDNLFETILPVPSIYKEMLKEEEGLPFCPNQAILTKCFDIMESYYPHELEEHRLNDLIRTCERNHCPQMKEIIMSWFDLSKTNTEVTLLTFLKQKLNESTGEMNAVYQYIVNSLEARDRLGFGVVTSWKQWNWNNAEEAEFAYDVHTPKSYTLCFYTKEETPDRWVIALRDRLKELSSEIEFDFVSYDGEKKYACQFIKEADMEFGFWVPASFAENEELYLKIKERVGCES